MSNAITTTDAVLRVACRNEDVVLDVDFYRIANSRVILTYAQAKALKDALDDAICKAAYTILTRQQGEADSKWGVQ